MIPVYCRHASPEFNQRLHGMLERLRADVLGLLGDGLLGLAVGGGYGRGEGGVVQRKGREEPYNDLDLVLVVRQGTGVDHMGLERISEKYHEETGLHIDFTRPMTLGDIASWPCWLMWQDILFGHIIIYGPEDLLTAHAPASLREALPELEASRLLLNRGAGLLWALRVTRGVEAPEDSDFVRRNFSKAALSLGDSLLIAYKRHSVSYKGRDKRLRQLAQTESAVQALDLEMLYEEALRFKFRPDAVPSEPNEEALQGLADLWGKVFLQIESKRHLRRWVTLEDYIHWGGLREPEEHMPAKWPRNLARNMQIGLWSWRYPREKLYQRLPVLLGLVAEKPGNWSDASASFLQIWKKMV